MTPPTSFDPVTAAITVLATLVGPVLAHYLGAYAVIASSGGNLLFWQPLATPKTVAAGASAPRFSAGQRSIEVQ